MGKNTDVKEEFFVVDKISPIGDDFNAVKISGEEVLKINKGSNWGISHVLVDFDGDMPKDYAVIVLKRKR